MQNPTIRLLRTATLPALLFSIALSWGCSKDGAPTAPSPVTTAPEPPASAPVSGPSDSEIQSLVDLVNNHRRSRGLNPLLWDERVAAVAQAHSQDMVDRNFYGHINPDGEGPDDRLTEAGIRYTWWGENYCYGFSTASSAFNFWINSSSHRANIENGNFTHHGVGKVGSVWTHVFIRPETVTSVELSSHSGAPAP